MLIQPRPQDTTTQTIETIWPLSKSCPKALSGDQKLIPLRTFVQEVLKRSRTSYSTLLVALHYLILIMSSVPKYGNFTMEQVEDSEGCRAMQCGRRMFLAALILASKYLQDRNYSTRAWGKISGLQVSEINTNERVFLSAVHWKLHIPELLFQRWERIVLKYSPSAASNPPRSCPTACRTWQSLIPQLNSELDQFDDKGCLISDNDSGYYSSSSRASSRDSSPHTKRTISIRSIPPHLLPTDPSTIPRYLEPTPCEATSECRMLPPLQPREGPLPTPTFTPRNIAFCTPAVSASGLLPRKSSMAVAQAHIRNRLDKSLLDKLDGVSPLSATSDPMFLRRCSRTSSIASQCSSSPDSTVWDQLANPSRSSSISSVSSSASTVSKPDLAWQAMHRRVDMQSATWGPDQSGFRGSSFAGDVVWNDPFSKPEAARPGDGFNISLEMEGSTPSPPDAAKERASAPIDDERTPRAARSCTPNTGIPCQKTFDAAVALCELDLERMPHFPPRPQPTSDCRSRERERPRSIDTTVQCMVRERVKPRSLGNVGHNDPAELVLPDTRQANSSFLRNDHKSADCKNKRSANDLRWLAADECRKSREAARRVVRSCPWSETDSGSNSSLTPRKKTCVPASCSEQGKTGLCVRSGNTMPMKAATPSDAGTTPIRSQKLRPQSRSASRTMGLKENQAFHTRSTSAPSIKPASINHALPETISSDIYFQAASAELKRMVRVSVGECTDDRSYGKLWGQIM
jgi:hypothetical protein